MLHRLTEQLSGERSSGGEPLPWAARLGIAAAAGILYFVAAHVSLFLLTELDGVAVFWPAAGISAGALVALGPAARFPVVAGVIGATVAANLAGDRNLASTIVFALSNAGEALLTAWLIERQFGSGYSLDSFRRVLGLLAAAGIATAVSGIGGTLGFVLFHGSTAPLTTWYHWFASDALGIVTVAPLVIGLARSVHDVPRPPELVEGASALAMLGAASVIGFTLPTTYWMTILPLAWLLPVLFWLAARCRPVFTAAAVFVLTSTIVSTITFGFGRLGDPSVPLIDRVQAGQAALLAVTWCALALAALFAERRQHEVSLRRGAERLQEALSAGAVMAFEWDARTYATQRSANAAQIIGFAPQEAMTAARFLARVHPDDRATFKAHLFGVRPDKPSYAASFRFTRPDGREVWLEETATAEFNAQGDLLRVKGLARDVSQRKRAEEHQSRLMAELDHRVKNMLARLSAVAMFTRGGKSTMDEFLLALDGRIRSLADAHVLLSISHWQGVSLADLVHRQLAPYMGVSNTAIGGPDTRLPASATEVLMMVLFELVTNAAKYGAFSTPHGQVCVTWNGVADGRSSKSVVIEWRESGGPLVAAPTRSSYGTSLIRELIPHELGGTVDLTFPPEGVSCRIVLPLSSPGTAIDEAVS
jgi:PAS domain S-box-containing protein